MAKHKGKPDPYKPLNPYYGSAVFKPGKPSTGSGGGADRNVSGVDKKRASGRKGSKKGY